MRNKFIAGFLVIIVIFTFFWSRAEKEELYTLERQSVTEINGQIINTSAKYISFANYNTSFIANNDLLETSVSPIFYYFNEKVFLPLDLVFTELGYSVTKEGSSINIVDSNENYTLNTSKNTLYDNNQEERISEKAYTSEFNDILFIELGNLTKFFNLYYDVIDGVYCLSNDSNQFLHENVINQYKFSAVPEFKAIETEENFNKYIEVRKEINYIYKENFFLEMVYYYISPLFSQYEETSTEGASDSDFSDTITQYSDVDEGDIIKTDGEYIYFARVSQYYRDTVEIISTSENGEMTIKSNINLENTLIQDIYLENDYLVIVGDYLVERSSDPINRRLDLLNKEIKDQSFIVEYDIGDKENPILVSENYFTGNYYDSRVVDGRVYVYTNAYMFDYYSYNLLPMYKNSLDGKFKNIPYENIYYNSDIDGKFTLNIFSCKIDDKNEELIGYSYFLGYSANININSDNIYIAMSNERYIEPVTMYMNTNNISALYRHIEKINNNQFYSEYSKSKIAKLSYEDGVFSYVDIGYVDGWVDNQYSVDEYESNLRVVTSNARVELEPTEENPEEEVYGAISSNKLYVLDENMNIVGETKGFGDEEEIKAVRFMGEKAYVVTFRTTDPLFVFDLEDITKPSLLGELKIPGFSTFLLPFEENYLIGFGVDTEETEDGGFTANGLKLSLFDITDYLNPIEKSSVNLGKYRSYALDDPKAIMYNPSRKIIGVPINNEYYGVNEKDIFNGAVVYGVDIEKGFIHLGDVKHLIDVNENTVHESTESSDNGNYSSSTAEFILDESGFVKRIVQINSNIYTVSDIKIQSNTLTSFEMLSELYFNNVNK